MFRRIFFDACGLWNKDRILIRENQSFLNIIYNIKIDFYFGEYLSVDVASLFLSRVEVELKDSIGLSSPSRPE